MSEFTNTAEVEVRERRLQAILSYHGNAEDLLKKSNEGELKSINRTYSQCSSCAFSCSANSIVTVEDAVVIGHSPIGCSTQIPGRNVNVLAATGSWGMKPRGIRYISSNIEEKDTIYGAAEKLRTAIREADKRYHPKVIFIQSSCASGIIGEDLESIAGEMEQEVGYSIVPVYCEGFKSKIWASGFDASYHGILRKLVKAPKEKQKDLVNVFSFVGSDTFSKLLGKLGVRVNYMVTLNNLEEIEKMTEATCSATICETLSTYITNVLEKDYNVPNIVSPPPYGINWTDNWLREIAKFTGKSDIVEEVIKSEHERIRPRLEELRQQLQGKTIYVMSGQAFAYNLSNIAYDLGLKIVGVNQLHHDQHYDGDHRFNALESLVEKTGNIENISVCNLQPYEIIKVLKKLKPDILLARHRGITPLGTKLGIVSLLEGDSNSSIGYDGLISMGERLVEALQTQVLVDNFANHAQIPYSKWWLEEIEDPFYFEGGKTV